MLDGRDDLVVSVEETRLEGAHDFLEVRAPHTFLDELTRSSPGNASVPTARLLRLRRSAATDRPLTYRSQRHQEGRKFVDLLRAEVRGLAVTIVHVAGCEDFAQVAAEPSCR